MNIRKLSGKLDANTKLGIAAVLKDCVDGGASVSFMHPFPVDESLAFWDSIEAESMAGDAILFVAEDDQGAVGTVLLHLVRKPNQPHRAEIAKMLVHRRARRQGVAAALLAAAEAEAASLGRWLLVLDTVRDSDAYRLYSKLGWQKSGVIPDYALMPDGALCDTVVFWKRLRPSNV